MPQTIFRLCLTLALSCCLLAPAANADEDGADVWSEEDTADLRAGAEAGDDTAQFILGLMYEEGDHVPQDDREAAVWYRKAAEQGHDKAQNKLGEMYHEGRGVPQDEQEAAAWYRKAAEQDNSDAQFELGWRYEDGEGVPQNGGEAAKWYRKAAEQGHTEARYKLGGMYDAGRGVPQDDKEATVWYRKAAEKGHADARNKLGEKEEAAALRTRAEAGDADAQYKLGGMHEHGRSVARDEKVAALWYRKAAEQGHAEAQYKLGGMYDTGRGVPQDDKEATVWYRKAAEQGHADARNKLGEKEAAASLRVRAEAGDADAQYKLGGMYEYGRGVERDEQEAAAWYRKAAEQGRADALYKLGWLYENGVGMPEDKKEAVVWYRKAAEQGHADARYNLGWLYESGEGVPEDKKEAVAWYRKAAEQSHARAQYKLGELYESGEGVPQDEQEAVAWYRKAAEQGEVGARIRLEEKEKVAALLAKAEAGDADARYALGKRYEKGEGVAQDDKEALAWYRKAAEQGHTWGLLGVGRMYEEGRGGLTRDLKEAEARYAKAAERLGEEPVAASDEQFALRRQTVEGIEGPLYRLRGGVVFKRHKFHASAGDGSVHVVVDYPESGDPKELAALRKAVESMIDGDRLAYSTEAAKTLKTVESGLQARFDAMTKAADALGERWHYDGRLFIEVLHQDKKTVTFKATSIVGYADAPVDHGILVKEDGRAVKRGELFVLPGTMPDDEATDGEEAERVDAAEFVAWALEGDNMLGAWSGGLFISEGRSVEVEVMDDPAEIMERASKITGGASVSWADLAPYLTARGRELFAEHLPEQVKGAWCAEETCPVLPEFRQVEKTISVQRGKGEKQTAAKVKAVVDWPEGGEPKATNALRKGVDALLAQCAAGQGITEVMLSLRFRDPRLATYECMAWTPKKYEWGVYLDRSTPFSATLSAADGRRIGLADLAEVEEEEWEDLMASAETEENFREETPELPAPDQAGIAVLYDRLKITSPKAEDFSGWSLPYDDLLGAFLTPEGKALLGR